MNNARFSGVVLAGGRSTRMGRDKAFLEVDGETLIARQLRLLREAGGSELLISGREEVDYSAFGARAIYDTQSGRGPLAGLASALRSAASPLVLVLAVDMPAMTAAMLRTIVEGSAEGRGCIPVEEGRLQPLAATYPRELSPVVDDHLDGAQLSLQSVVEVGLSQGLLRLLPLTREERALFVNWNQPSDWREGGLGVTGVLH